MIRQRNRSGAAASGAWSTPLVMREQTAEEKKAADEAANRRRAEDAARALNAEAQKLADAVERRIASRDAGISSNYAQDEQYGVSGTWPGDVVGLAFNEWLEKFPNQTVALDMHELGPSQRWSGGRDGLSQYDFIRLKAVGAKGRYNVHIT